MMYPIKHLRAQAFVASFTALTLLPGVWTVAQAPLSGLGTDVINGSVQRLYEDRFDQSFPNRTELAQAWAAIKLGVLGEVANGAVAGRNGVLFTSEEFETPAPHRDFATALSTAQDRIANAGGELIPVIVPDKARMMPQALPRTRSDHFDARYDALLQIIAGQGLRTVDLRPALQMPGAFMATDTHWSPAGARSAAHSIAALLADELNGNTSFTTTPTGTRDFDGDLLAFANTGRWKPWVGPHSETIATFDTTSSGSDGLGLFDEVATPVALVGTSFSARDDFHFVGFLKSALNSDVLSFALQGRGPFVPMDQFLKGAALGDASPQLVIWEIPERYLDTWSLNQ